jgi:hypothetical protein
MGTKNTKTEDSIAVGITEDYIAHQIWLPHIKLLTYIIHISDKIL